MKTTKKLIDFMKGKNKRERGQTGIFEQELEVMLDQQDPLYKLANKIPWERFEVSYNELYSHTGRPAKTIRRMVGLLLVKQLKNVSDEEVCEMWRQSPYVGSQIGRIL